MRTVIVVDDEESILIYVRKILMTNQMQIFKHSVRVISCSDSASAERAIMENQDSLDLLVSDVMLPNESGWSLIDKVRKVLPDLPIVVMSGVAKDELQVYSMERSCVWIEKPFTIKNFISLSKLALYQDNEDYLRTEMRKNEDAYASMSSGIFDVLHGKK